MEQFFYQWSDVEVDLKTDLLAFQKEFVTDPEKSYPYKRDYHFNIFEYITSAKALEKTLNRCEFSLLEEFQDLQDYIGKLYFRRNIGWGKARIKGLVTAQ